MYMLGQISIVQYMYVLCIFIEHYVFIKLLCIFIEHYVFIIIIPHRKKKFCGGFWSPSDVRPSEQISPRPLTISLQNFTQARDGILPGN